MVLRRGSVGFIGLLKGPLAPQSIISPLRNSIWVLDGYTSICVESHAGKADWPGILRKEQVWLLKLQTEQNRNVGMELTITGQASSLFHCHRSPPSLHPEARIALKQVKTHSYSTVYATRWRHCMSL